MIQNHFLKFHQDMNCNSLRQSKLKFMTNIYILFSFLSRGAVIRAVT
jgi:hypothetical protein